jgi:glycosyltransferase involved in cell wall biosynthesis
MRINVIGPILGTDGYSNHTRGFINALFKLEPDIKLDTPLTPDWIRQVNDNELKMIQCPERASDVTIAIMTPPYWRLALGDNCKHFIGYCIWEGDKIPSSWIPYLMDDRVDLIFVPSQHTYDAIYNTVKGLDILMSKIRIVPHGVNTDIFKSIETKRDKKFTFICSKGWRGGYEDRGGVAYVLKAFSEEFKKDEEVELILKLNPAYINQQNLFIELDKLNLPKDRAGIKVNVQNMTPQELAIMYNEGDVFVCATRAESFNLPGLEAMACGIPNIQTGYGGQCDYIKPLVNGILISYKLEDVKNDIMYEGIKWAIPDIEDLKEEMRNAFEHQDKIKDMKDECLKTAKEFTWDNTAKLCMKYISELD